MALALTPRLLRRSLELFAIISLAGVVVVLAVYGENVQAVARALLHLHWGWIVVGLGLASMDWQQANASRHSLVTEQRARMYEAMKRLGAPEGKVKATAKP